VYRAGGDQGGERGAAGRADRNGNERKGPQRPGQEGRDEHGHLSDPADPIREELVRGVGARIARRDDRIAEERCHEKGSATATPRHRDRRAKGEKGIGLEVEPTTVCGDSTASGDGAVDPVGGDAESDQADARVGRQTNARDDARGREGIGGDPVGVQGQRASRSRSARSARSTGGRCARRIVSAARPVSRSSERRAARRSSVQYLFGG